MARSVHGHIDNVLDYSIRGDHTALPSYKMIPYKSDKMIPYKSDSNQTPLNISS